VQLLVSDAAPDGDRRVSRSRCRYRAKAWWRDDLIADSVAAVRVEEADRSPTLSTAINTISISLHADVRADRWVLYRHLATFAGDGMTHAECRVHDEAGRLLASFSVDAMVRGFRDSTMVVDDRTAM
jgi:hypothetical protein